ncbi:MAG: hypothetical protein WBG71_08240 [Leeuwenhoekiella sp.]
MKKYFLAFLLLLAMTSTFTVTSCRETTEDKVEDAADDIEDAVDDLD